MIWTRDPYKESPLVQQVLKTGELNCFDVDGNLFTTKGNVEEELKAQESVFASASKRGAVIILTARRKTMLMGTAAYHASLEEGFEECPPQFGFDERGLRVYVPTESVASLTHLIRAPLAIGALGEGISILNGRGYHRVDREYYYMLALGAEQSKHIQGTVAYPDWRNSVLRILRRADRDGDILRALAAIEFPRNYFLGVTDVPGPRYRIELKWDEEIFGKDALAHKIKVVARLRSVFAVALARHRVKIIDESNGERGQVYLTPVEACKRSMLDRIVDKASGHARRPAGQIHVNFTGDMGPDLEAGFLGARNASMNFGLAGGSPLGQALMERQEFFAGESLKWAYELMRPTGVEGVFDLVLPAMRTRPRRLLLLDAVFPGLIGPKSIEAFYNSKWSHSPQG